MVMPLTRNIGIALLLNVLFFYFGWFWSPIFMMFFTFISCGALAVCLSPKMKLDSGSALMTVGKLFGKDTWYPAPVINCVMNFENGCPSDEALVLKTKRILQLQRFRSVLVNHDLAFYRKLDDRGDITVKDMLTHHVVEGDHQKELIETLVDKELDYNKPLWELHHIHDEKFEKGSIVFRANHGLGDGIRLANVFFPIFFDDENGAPVRLPKFKPKKKKKNQFDILGKIRWFVDGLKLVDSSTKAVDSTTAFARPKQVLNTKSYSCTANSELLNLNQVKEIKNKIGCTVNDVLMTALTKSLRKYLVKRGQVFDDKFLFRCWCAMGIPTYDDTKLRNYFGVLPANIPVHLESRKDIVQAIRESMAKLKTTGALMITLFIQDVTCYFGLDRLVEGLFKDSFLNTSMVYSNVPSVQEQLFFDGKEVESLDAFFPNCLSQFILISYNNKIRISLTSDKKVVENPEEVVDGFVEEINDWYKEINETKN